MEKKLKETQLQETMKASRIKKEKMAKLDQERQSKLPPSQMTLEQQMRAQGLLSKAQMLLDEQLDDVKQMNEMVLYSKVVTIRDKQIQENK